MLPSPSGCWLDPRSYSFSRPQCVHCYYSPVTRDLPWEDLVDRLRRFCFHPLRYPNYGALTSTPAGLSPAEHASLHWTHNRTCRFPASGSRTRHHAFSRVTPSAVSERFSELLGCPISGSLSTSCVGLELRPLPSPSITRLQRYYWPLRHPSAPGLSLTGVRLIIPDHALGLPVLRALSLCTCCRQYPGAAAGRNPRSSHPAVAAFPDSAVGSACTSTFSRLARRSLALRPAHSRGHQVVTAIRRLQPFRYLHDCSDCFRRERIAGGALHPLESAALSRRTPIPDASDGRQLALASFHPQCT